MDYAYLTLNFSRTQTIYSNLGDTVSVHTESEARYLSIIMSVNYFSKFRRGMAMSAYGLRCHCGSRAVVKELSPILTVSR